MGAPTKKLTKSQLTIMCKLGRGPNTENFEKKFYRQCELGWGPITEAVTMIKYYYIVNH
ncbi:hypothetical protein JMUB7515_00270 [Staphylococcus aureus]